MNERCPLGDLLFDDNHSPEPVPGSLVHSSHQTSEISNTILCTFRNGLGNEATLINISFSNGDLSC